MTTRAVPILARDPATNVRLTGLAPVFTQLWRNDGTDLSATMISQVDAGTHPGEYEFTLTLTAGQSVRGEIDLGAAAGVDRLVDVVLYEQDLRDLPAAADVADAVWDEPLSGHTSAGTTGEALDDVPTAAEIDTELSGVHGGGPWGGAAGDGAHTVGLTVEAGGSPVMGARVDVLAGATVVARGYTDASGEVSLQLDAGTYTYTVTKAGYEWDGGSLVVSAGGTPTPDTLEGDVLAVASASGTVPTGHSRSLAWGELVTGSTITGIVTGDTVTITRTITGAPGAISKAWLTAKTAANRTKADTYSAFSKEVEPGAFVLSFALTSTDTNALAPAATWEFDVQVLLADGTVQTLEIGTLPRVLGVTTDVT